MPSVALSSLPDAIIGQSPSMQELRRLISIYADLHLPVLLEGESGCGKELAARALHRLSRGERAFLPVNCSAIPAGLVESVLFGHRKGAFTGAHTLNHGLFESVSGGTLFLDEIGELPLEAQAKLLRVLEEGEFCRLGETVLRVSHARVIAATNRDLRHEVRAGRFRADLYHRLSVYAIRLPVLREIVSDIALLLDAFRMRCATQAGMPPFELTSEAWARLEAYPFPGNVRELRNIVLRLQARHPGGQVSDMQLQAELDQGLAPSPQTAEGMVHPFDQALKRGGFSLHAELRRQERQCIHAALNMAQGNISAAARMLGLQRSTLCSRLQSLQLHVSE